QELLELAGNFRDSLTSLSNTQNRIRSSVDSLAATADRLGNSSAAGADTLARIESGISSSGTGGRNAAERLKEMVNDYSAQIRNIGASAAGAGQTVAEIRREADSMLRDAESLKNYAERIYERYESVTAVVDRISDGSSELLSAVKRLAGLDDSFATGLDYVSSGLGSISTGSEHLLAELQHTASRTFIINDRGLRTAGRALLNISVLQQTGTAAAAGEHESLKQLLAEDRGEFSDRSSHRVFYVDPEVYRRIGKDHQKVTVVYSGTRDEQTVERSVEFEAEIRALPVSADGTAFTTVALIGQLGLLQERDISDGVASDGKNAFMMKKRGYTGFRMYASSLDNVVKLQDQLTAEGIKTVSRSDRISEILSLDHYLSLLFLLIAAASLTGAVCCLVANVYAGVERKRRELAILRLLGVHGSQLCIFPIFSSLLLTLGGVLVSLVIFYILAYVVNACFVYQLSGGEKFCELQIEHVINVVIISLSIASFAGLVASRRVMRIDPSDSLRDE
ncbi:MAG: ABC transporter permease, partial [Succinivibrionaceae bacterium]|nr:ABC transporter permease [Succinivibrionaceae bacterium]